MIETATLEAPKPRGKRKKLPEGVPAPSAAPQENLPETPFDETKSAISETKDVEIAPWPDFGVWKAGGPKSEQKIPFTGSSNYWNKTLNPAQRVYGTWYTYRLWPVMKKQLQGNKYINPNCAKFSAEDGPISSDLIYSQLRTGIYLLRLLQRQTPPVGQVCMSEVEILGSGDFNEDEMPILNVDEVDWDHPSNAEYAKICRSRGILKADDPEPSEGAGEMAAQEVLGDIAKNLINERIQDRQQPQPAAPAALVDGGVGKELVGLLREQINQNRPAGEQGTVTDHVESLVKISKAMTPAPVDLTPFTTLQTQYNDLVRDMMEKDVKRAEAEVKKAREEVQALKESLPKPKTVQEQFAELEEASKAFDRITGKRRGRRDDEDEEKPAETMGAAGWAGTILGAAPVILQMWDRFNYTIAVMKGVPPSMLPAQPANGNGASAGTQPMDNVVPINGQPLQEEEDDSTPTHQPTQEEQMELLRLQTLSNLLPPMLTHFQEKKSGEEFAAFVIGNKNFGQPVFDMIRAYGRQNIINRLSEVPQIWNTVGPQIQPFSKFLDEFLKYRAVPVQ